MAENLIRGKQINQSDLSGIVQNVIDSNSYEITYGGTGININDVAQINLSGITINLTESIFNITGMGANIRPTVNGTGVLLIGEASSATISNVVYTTGNQLVSGIKIFGSGNFYSGNSINITINGGAENRVSGNYIFIGGGRCNLAEQSFASLVGGFRNLAIGAYSATVGGENNKSAGGYSFVGGGRYNSATANFSNVGGGYRNCATASYSNVGGGFRNCATGNNSNVGGGYRNCATANFSNVGGGFCNCATANFSNVGGGRYNSATASYSNVGGGYNNRVLSNNATIAGGVCNCAAVNNSIGGSIGGGLRNFTAQQYSTIGGGCANSTSGCFSVIGGGGQNCILNRADYSYIAGGRCSVVLSGHSGAAVLGDGQLRAHNSYSADSLTLDFQSGVYFSDKKIFGFTPELVNVTSNFNITGTLNSDVVLANSATEITGNIVSGNATGFNLSIIQIGAGQIQITGSGSNVIVSSYNNQFKTAGQFATISLLHTGNNRYIMYGNTI